MRKVRRPSPSPCDSDSDVSFQSGNSLAPISRIRRRSPVPTANYAGSVMTSGFFQKFLFLLVVVVIFDIVYLLDYFDGLDEISDGPEAGLHHLHKSRRIGNLYRQVTTSGLNLDHSYLGNFSDREKINILEHEVEAWKNKYEDAMGRGENPYRQVPFTPIPPNEGNDDGMRHRKKSRTELENEETYGVDENIVKILHSASVEIDKELAEQLPTWDDVVSLYGDRPIIHGLETCEPYRQAVTPENRMTGPAGMFNTGTNLVSFPCFADLFILIFSWRSNH